MGGVITLAFVVILGVATYGWFLRFFGTACFVVGSCFAGVWAMTGRADLGGYLAFGLLIVFGIGFWLGGHMIHWKFRGWFRTEFGKQCCVLMARGYDRLVLSFRNRRAWRAAGV